ncbi:Hypothetical protein KLENKIAIHU_4938, partial [Klenkia terrae]|uniref:hypothetical protein n=1 Tax=Klenkia terrae TaxID=1052259 RepID=UPI00176C1FDC
GLGHSSELQCPSSLESGACQTRSYYDFYDVMGISWGQVGSLNAAQAALLGLLPTGEQVALTSSSAATTVNLAPLAAPSGTRAIKLTTSDGTVYYLEYRQASGQDSWLGDSRNAYDLDSGVVLRRAASADGNTSLLLDGSPSSPSAWADDLQTALPVGVEIQVAGGDVAITVAAVTSGGASVTVGRLSRSPVASWESLSAVGGQVVVSGWSVDPDQVSVSGAVHVYVDGVGVAVTADGERGDVAARFPGGGSRHGFSYTARVAPGVHSVCVYAIDVDPAARHAALGCRSITTQLASPVASWESLSAVGGQVVVSGWSVDPDQVSVSGAVHVYVDGVG